MFKRKALLCALLALGCANVRALDIPTLDVGNEASGIAVDPVLGFAFVTNYADGTLSEVDIQNLSVSTLDVGPNPRRAVVNAVSHLVYFVNDTSPGTVTVFNSLWNMPVTKIRVGDRPRNLAADFAHGELYVVNRDSDSVSVIDLGVNKVVSTIAVGHLPGAIDLDPTLGRIYVASAADRAVSIIDQRSKAVIAAVAVGANPGAVTVDERSGKVYVNNVDDDSVSVIDGRNATLLATIGVGAGSTFGTVSAIYHRYYLPNATDGTVSIIDTDNDVLLRTVGVGDAPQQVVIDEGAGAMYVVNRIGSDIAQLDTDGTVLAGRTPAGPSPSRITMGLQHLIVMNERNGVPDSVTVLDRPSDVSDATSIVTEYVAPALQDFFHSKDSVENRLIADGLFGDTWQRTMEFWRVWDDAAPGRHAVCRFSSTDGSSQGNGTHFFTADDDECAALKSSPAWTYEGDAYYVARPDASGACSGDTVALYRLYNGGADGVESHRYTTDGAANDRMKAQGWISEGSGAGGVFACVPPLIASTRATICPAPEGMQIEAVRPASDTPVMRSVHLASSRRSVRPL